MAANIVVSESNGPLSTAIETLDPTTLNMGSVDAAELDPSSYPITAQVDGHAFEKWVRLYLSDLGGSTIVDNFKVWLSSLGGGWKTGEGMSSNVKPSAYSGASYPVGGPVASNSSVAIEVMPESEPANANLGIGGSLSGQLSSAPAYSDWIVLQLDVSNLTPAGGVNQKTITFQWDEQ